MLTLSGFSAVLLPACEQLELKKIFKAATLPSASLFTRVPRYFYGLLSSC